MVLDRSEEPSDRHRIGFTVDEAIGRLSEGRNLDVAYTAAGWTDFSVGTLGAAATLVGLLFVAVSINLTQILALDGLPARASQTLLFLATPLFAALFVLIPGQARSALAAEILLLAVVTGGVHLQIMARSVRPDSGAVGLWLANRVLPAAGITTCLFVAGATMLARTGGGLYWIAPTAALGILFGITNAWVLLVEILR